jgi:uncharacterized protein YndB with AHSA1/START domain
MSPDRVFEKTFTVAVPRERAWLAFTDSHERSQWEAEHYEIDPTPGGKVHWTLPGLESSGVVEDVVPLERITHREGDGPHRGAVVTATFSDVEGGTRITITHSGFGDGAEWLEGTSLGWTQAVADLVCYLTTGVPARRFVTGMRSPGMFTTDTQAGVVVETVHSEGLAAEAGLRAGDLVLSLSGVPVYSISDLWVLMRGAKEGDRFDVEYVRAGERCGGSGRAGTW